MKQIRIFFYRMVRIRNFFYRRTQIRIFFTEGHRYGYFLPDDTDPDLFYRRTYRSGSFYQRTYTVDQDLFTGGQRSGAFCTGGFGTYSPQDTDPVYCNPYSTPSFCELSKIAVFLTIFKQEKLCCKSFCFITQERTCLYVIVKTLICKYKSSNSNNFLKSLSANGTPGQTKGCNSF